MENSTFITIRSMSDTSVSEYMITRLNPWENKAPMAIHTVGPSLNIKTGMFNIDFNWLDFELLGIKLYKDDNPQLVAYKTNMNNYRQKKILDIQSKLGEVGLQKIETQTNLQKKEQELSEVDKEIVTIDKKIEIEKLKDKRNEATITKLSESLNAAHDKKLEIVSAIDYINNSLEIYKKSENNLIDEMDSKDMYISNLEKEIKQLEEKNKKNDEELKTELAKRIGAETLDSRVDNIVWSKIVKPLKVDNNDIVLDRSNPIQALQLCMLMGNNVVALSQRFEDIHNPKLIKAQYYIYNEEKETQVKLGTFEIKQTAFQMCANLSMYAKREILNIIGVNTWSLSDNVVNGKISEMVESVPDKFIDLAKLESVERERRSFVSELVNYRIINIKTDGSYYGTDENDVLAYSFETLVAHVFNPNNKLKLQWFESELNMRKSKTDKLAYA